MREVKVASRSIDGFRQVLESDDYAGFEDALEALRSGTRARTIWHVNSVANGGGVAEILGTFLPYAACAGIDVHWLVIEGDAEFFEVTKRIHNRLHEQQGDGGRLDRKAREVYDANLAKEIQSLRHPLHHFRAEAALFERLLA
jgi:trehalose synthase